MSLSPDRSESHRISITVRQAPVYPQGIALTETHGRVITSNTTAPSEYVVYTQSITAVYHLYVNLTASP